MLEYHEVECHSPGKAVICNDRSCVLRPVLAHLSGCKLMFLFMQPAHAVYSEKFFLNFEERQGRCLSRAQLQGPFISSFMEIHICRLV